LGHPKKTKETEFGNNHPKPLESLAKNGISLEGITIFLKKILPNPELLQSVPGRLLQGPINTHRVKSDLVE
jgi:hypothetical protein